MQVKEAKFEAEGWHSVHEFHVPLCLPEYIGKYWLSCCVKDAGCHPGLSVWQTVQFVGNPEVVWFGLAAVL